MVKNPSQIHTNKIEPYLGLFETESDQSYALGTSFTAPDGRIFRYGKAGSALSKALMHQGPAVKSDYTSTSGHVSTVSSGKTITLKATTTLTSISKDLFAGGYLVVHNGNGAGQLFKVASHDAWSPTTTGDTLQVKLETDVHTKISSGDTVSLYQDRFNGVEVVPAAGVGAPLCGVPLVDISDGDYGWFQTRGPCPLLMNSGSSLAMGDDVGEPASTSDAGACSVILDIATDEAVSLDNKRYGWIMSPVSSAGHYANVFLELE